MKALLDGLRTWPWRVLDWLQQEEAKRTYQFIVPIIVTFGGCWAIFGTWEARFRWSGLVLQLLGLLLVVIGLSEARKRFGRPSLLDAARSFLRRFPTLKPRTHSMIEGSGGLTFGGAAVIGFGTVGPAAPKSLEERVALIEVELKDVRAEINKAGEQIAKESRERIQALEAERRARESEQQEIRKRLEEEIVGGLHLETMGVWWIALGIFLSTASQELERFIF